jgi:hypothetical protein
MTDGHRTLLSSTDRDMLGKDLSTVRKPVTRAGRVAQRMLDKGLEPTTRGRPPRRGLTRRGVRRSALALAAVISALALAVVVVPVWVLRDWNATPESSAFVSTPQFVLWLLILCGQAAIWVGAASLVFATVRRRLRHLRWRRALDGTAIAAITSAALALLLVAVVFNFGTRFGLFERVANSQIPRGEQWPLTDHETKMPGLAAVGFLIGFAAIAGMWLTTLALEDVARNARPRASWVKHFIGLRTELTTLLAIAGVLIGLATLSSGALREAVLAANDEPHYRNAILGCLADKPGLTDATARAELASLLSAYPECRELVFDRRYVVAYGLLFTGLLAIAFAPSFVAMRRAGARLRDRTYPLPNPQDATFFEVVQKRRSFDELLQTNLSAGATFKAAVAIATPLAASLVSTLVPS